MKKPASSAPKPRDTKGTILRLFQTMLHERALFVLALGLTLAGNLLGLIGPSLAGEAIDAIGARRSRPACRSGRAAPADGAEGGRCAGWRGHDVGNSGGRCAL